jgi:cytoskeletal protein RodZ
MQTGVIVGIVAVIVIIVVVIFAYFFMQKAIVVSTKTVSVVKDASVTVTITNYSKLTNVAATPADAKIATATIDATGIITIKGVAAGTSTIDITADKKKTVTINVTVTAT